MSYNVTKKTVINHPAFTSVNAILTSEVQRLRQIFDEVMPKGFQSMIEVENLDTGKIEYAKGIVYGTSGTFAAVKMDTLRKFRYLALTGACTIPELIEMIYRQRSHYDVSTFSSLENVCQLTRAQHEELRREIGITAYLGGIRIPFIRFTSFFEEKEDDEKNEEENAEENIKENNEAESEAETRGEVRIAFSALSGEGDLSMCIILFNILQDAMQKAEPNTTYSFDFSALKQNSIAHYLLKVHGSQEVAEK